MKILPKTNLIRLITVVFAVMVISTYSSTAQELDCNINVVTKNIQGSNKQVFETLQTSLREFMNNTSWTNHSYQPEERIECNILINITQQVTADEFTADIQIQSRRPVYGSSYNTVLLNYKDANFDFEYVEFQPLEFNLSSFQSNLTSVLAYYAYIIIGLDYDTYSSLGGTPFFEKAERIVTNAQSATEKGWKSMESTSRKNRYWLINNILDNNYKKVREFSYQYHRHGLDAMGENIVEGREAAMEALRKLQGVYREKPDPFMHYLQIMFDAKSDEFVEIFKEASTKEKFNANKILVEIDPANTDKYSEINTRN